jgi:hypothetical protein
VNVADGSSADTKVGLPEFALIGIPKEPSQFLAEARKLVTPRPGHAGWGYVGAKHSALR